MIWSLVATVKLVVAVLSVPLAMFVVELTSVERISSSVMPLLASLAGSTWMRIAGVRSPKIDTCATPETCEICWARNRSAYSSTVVSGMVSDRSDSSRIGESAGLTFL